MSWITLNLILENDQIISVRSTETLCPLCSLWLRKMRVRSTQMNTLSGWGKQFNPFGISCF